MINYTIIIPHKNTPDLLAYCLSTIPERDDVQVIVVDDNSDASKVDFENFPQWKGVYYECYFTKEGKGAGYARNVGLDHAKGNWVLFVDADDFLLPSINKIFDESNDSVADIIYFRPQAVMLKDRKSPSNRADAYNALVDEYEESHDENNLRCRFFSPTCKFVRRSLIEKFNIRFEEIKYSNDNLFAVLIGCNAKTIEVRDETYYVITECNNSLRSNYLNKPGELEMRAAAFFRVQKIVYEKHYKLDENQAFMFLSRLLTENKNLFVNYYKLMLSFGYKRKKLIKSIYRSNKLSSKIKRTIYTYYVILCEP